MQAKEVERMFETVLPRELIENEARRLGVQRRQRLLDVPALIVSGVLMGGSAEAGRMAATVRDFDRGNTRVERGAFYKCFDGEFLALIKVLSERALGYVRAMPKHFLGILAGRLDWRAVDSTTIRLPESPRLRGLGAGDYAALKVHTGPRVQVGAREHAAMWPPVLRTGSEDQVVPVLQTGATNAYRDTLRKSGAAWVTQSIGPGLAEGGQCDGINLNAEPAIELSLGCENVGGYHISPACDHDISHRVVDVKRCGTGLIVDLGCVSHDLFLSARQHDVALVVRLKDGWRLRLNDTVDGGEAMTWTATEATIDRLEKGASLAELPAEALDVDVVLGPRSAKVPARLVSMSTPEAWRYFLTNLPRSTHTSEEVAVIYRLRWSVELHNKLAKSGCQLRPSSWSTSQ